MVHTKDRENEMADRITVGNAEIIAVMDMVPPPRAPEQMFPNVSADEWNPYQDILESGRLAFGSQAGP